MNQIDFDDLDMDEDQVALGPDGEPYTGEVIERDTAGNVVAVITYRNGFKDGKETHFYPDGTLAFEGVWRFAEVGVGVHRSWYENGKIKAVTYYDEAGQIERVEDYREDGSRIR